jgi:hypothetical protein
MGKASALLKQQPVGYMRHCTGEREGELGPLPPPIQSLVIVWEEKSCLFRRSTAVDITAVVRTVLRTKREVFRKNTRCLLEPPLNDFVSTA